MRKIRMALEGHSDPVCRELSHELLNSKQAMRSSTANSCDRISISKGNPYWCPNLISFNKLGPTVDILEEYKTYHDEAVYRKRFIDEVLNRLDVDKVMAVGESIGVTWFQPLVLTDHVTGQVYETPVKYLVLDTPVRRQIQHLISKISTGEGHAVDHLGGQATGDAKASSVSLPELTQLDGRGFQASPIEFIKVRGGDEAAYKAMEQAVAQTGGFSLGPIMEMGTKPKAVQTLRSLLLGMHLRPTGLD
jgi:hypothetical protein